MIISSWVEKKTLTNSRLAVKDLPEPGVPRIRPFGFLSCFLSATIILLEMAFKP